MTVENANGSLKTLTCAIFTYGKISIHLILSNTYVNEVIYGEACYLPVISSMSVFFFAPKERDLTSTNEHFNWFDKHSMVINDLINN